MHDSFSTREKKCLWLLAGFYLIAVSVSVWLHRLPVRDMAHRYIPMAEAFAAGDFDYAFHPRIQPLQPVCGGIVAFLTGADGFLALKIASALWSIAGGILICILFRELYRKERWVAVLGTALYAFFPYMFHMAYSGLRESAKGCLLILLALGLVRIRRECRSLNGFILTGIGAGLAFLVRAEMFALSLFCLFVAGVFECAGTKFPRRTALATLIAFAVEIPYLLLSAGYYRSAMPDIRFIQLFLRMTGRLPGVGDALLLCAGIGVLLPLAAWAAAPLLRRINAGWLWLAAAAAATAVTVHTALTGVNHDKAGYYVYHFLGTIGKSLYYYVAPIALIHAGAEVRRKRLRPEDHAVLMVVAANLFLCTLQMQLCHRTLELSPRYVFPATPLLFGLFILGVRDLYRWFLLILPRAVVNFMLFAAWTGLAVMYVYHAPQPLFREYHHPRRIAEQRFINETKQIILRDYRGKGMHTAHHSLWYYNSRRHPKVWFTEGSKITIAAYLAGGSLSPDLREADYAVAVKRPPRAKKIIGRVSDGHRDYVIWRMR